VKRHRAIVVAAVLGALVVAAVVVFVIAPWGDPNHQTAEQVVRNAGVPSTVTTGSPP
jgi:hypothetical protein